MNPTSQPAAGNMVGDRYSLHRRIGEGAAGEVWLARDTELHIDVAVKILHGKHAATGAARARVLAGFAREADLAERMLSPHVVKVLARGLLPSGAPYIVYEHLEGEDLGARLAKTRQLSLYETRTVVVHACRALARAHAVGALHRDVKPANLFLTQSVEGRLLVKLLDFGIADLLADHGPTEAGLLTGTLEYLAPEVLLGEGKPSPQSDVFSIGVVAYECLTGRRPRTAADVGQLVASFATVEVMSARELRPEIPAELEAWLVRAMNRDLEIRFSTAKEAAEMFEIAVAAAGPLPGSAPKPRPSVADLPRMRPAYSSYAIIHGEDVSVGDAPPDGEKR
ncbi:MAG: serine/threonine protein kinase [Deltaproteobacteria bacterium]|nr:serine/threonine protein kinase [Deltaproteobacteria bacterium]